MSSVSDSPGPVPPTDSGQLYERHGVLSVEQLVDPMIIKFLLEYLMVRSHAGAMSIDSQVPGSEALYGDPAFDTLLGTLTPRVSRMIGIPLLPTYSFVRIYTNGDELTPHVDRPECQHSLTLHLGASSDTPWPIMLVDLTGNSVNATLKEGDAVIYQGTTVKHWRQPCEHEWYAQAFLHFVEAGGPYRERIFDRRPYLGTAQSTKPLST